MILTEAFMDPDWGTLVLLTMTTGPRRGGVCGFRWPHLDLDAGLAKFYRSIGQIAGEQWERDTKTHQHRRVSWTPSRSRHCASTAPAARTGGRHGHEDPP